MQAIPFLKIPDINILRTSALFSSFSCDELTQLLNMLHAKVKEYKKDETVYTTGSNISSLGVVITGKVHIQLVDWWGNLNILHEIKSADIFGEAFATTSGIPLANDVVAAEDSRILFINVQWVLASAHITDPLKVQFIQNLYRISSARNRYLTKKIQYLTCRSTRDKLIAYLSEQSRLHKSETFDIPFDRQQLADYLSVERSALSAELGKMQADGLLTFKKNHFTLSCAQ